MVSGAAAAAASTEARRRAMMSAVHAGTFLNKGKSVWLGWWLAEKGGWGVVAMQEKEGRGEAARFKENTLSFSAGTKPRPLS